MSIPSQTRAFRARLPVPILRHTLNRYLDSLEPFLHEDERRGGMPFSSAYALREKWANEFESGIGGTLQERLLALDKVSPHNWLDDNFWINKAYLEWRTPLLVNSNWWLAFHDDPTIPTSALSGETNNNRAGTTFWQIRRSAWLIHRMLQFKENIAETKGTSPMTTSASWLLETTTNIFNIARIPEPFCDTLSEYPDTSTRASRSILVMVHDWCYSVVVYDPPAGDSPPKLSSPGEIETRIRAVVLDVETRLQDGEKAVPIGVLSADDRDRWSKNLQHLLSLSPINQKTHQVMLHSAMALSLDHTTYMIPPASLSSHKHTRTTSQNALDSHVHTTRGTTQNVSNRFFDKPFTIIVDPSTRAGASGEHSPVDALVPSIVAEYGIVQGVDPEAFELRGTENEVDGKGWERLDWVADEKMLKECQAATERANAIINNSDDSILWFDKFGSKWIGNYNLSPDAFVQMAIQLAWYKTRGEFTATYETVLTRMFKHGRTETLRTFSRESRRWVLSMLDPLDSQTHRFRLLQQAISSHCLRIREAMTGRGIDRHLLGLRHLLRPLNAESSALLDDDLFKRSSRWKLSTSGLSAGLLFKGTGFGTVYEDGYGINYLVAPDMIKFGIESKFSSRLTSTEKFKEAIAKAMDEMYSMCEAAQREGSGLQFQASSHL